MILLSVTLCTTSCAQQVGEEPQLMKIEERLHYLKNQVKKYDQQPIYRLSLTTQNAYKVLINGFPVGNSFGDLGTDLNTTINHAILRSGDQEIEIQIYPGYRAGGSADELSDQDFLNLSIVRTAWEAGELKEPEPVYAFKLNEQEAYAGEPVFIFKGSFKAAVPYSLQGWQEARPFDVTDSLAIKQKLHAKYKEVITAYENRNTDFIWTAYLQADAEWYQSEYFDSSTIESFQRKFMRRGKTLTYGRAQQDIDGVEFFPLEDFKLAFYCDNKIACLEFADGKFKGESKFAYKAVASLGRNEVQFFDLFYMQDSESKDGRLVIVR